MKIHQNHSRFAIPISVLFICFFFSISLAAQIEDDEYHPWLEGYVVLEEGDTLFGEIRNTTPHAPGDGVMIRDLETKALQEFGPKDVLGYHIGEDTFFSKKLNKKWGFLKLIRDGMVKLYEGRQSNAHSYSFGNEGLYSETNSRFYMIEKGDVFERVRSSGFRTEIVKFFDDDEKLCEAIKKKQLKYQSIVLIVDLYNGVKEW